MTILDLLKVPPEKYSPQKISDSELKYDLTLAVSWGTKGAPDIRQKAQKYALKIIPELLKRGKVTFHFESWKEAPRKFLVEIFKRLFTSGIYLVPPHGEMIYKGRKTAIVKVKPDQRLPETFSVLVSGKHAFGFIRAKESREITVAEFQRLKKYHRITEDERNSWWPNKEKFQYYEIRDFLPFEKPHPVEVVHGIQTRIKKVSFDDASWDDFDEAGVVFLERRSRIYKPFNFYMGSHFQYGLLKSLLRKQDWDLYCEPFCGSASVFWGLRRDIGNDFKAILSDLHPTVIFIFRFLKGLTPEQAKRVRQKNCKFSVARYKEFRKSKFQDPVDEFFRAIYVAHFSFGGLRVVPEKASLIVAENRISTSLAIKSCERRLRSTIERLEYFRDALKNTTVLQDDALVVIEKFNSSKTFFYIDPPYQKWSMKDEGGKDGLIARIPAFNRVLKSIKGRFIMETTGESPILHGIKGFHRKKIVRKSPLKSEKNLSFVFLSNFPIDPKLSVVLDDEPEDLDALLERLSELSPFELICIHGWLHGEADQEDPIPQHIAMAHLLLVSRMKQIGMEHRWESFLDEESEMLAAKAQMITGADLEGEAY